MFKAKLVEGIVLRKIVESIKDLVNEVNIAVSPEGKFDVKHFNFSFSRHINPSNGCLSRGSSVP